MTSLKRRLLALAFLFLSLLLFRGPLFRSSIHYTPVGARAGQILHDSILLAQVSPIASSSKSIEDLLSLAIEITNRSLHFSTSPSSRNANTCFRQQKANCIGYAALLNAIINHLLKSEKWNGKYQSHHLIGQLDLWGIDLHQYFSNPFFHDHDFVAIENLETGEVVYIDPTLSDYLKIHRVSTSVQ